MAHIPGQTKQFYEQTHDPLKNRFWYKLNHRKQRRSNFTPSAFHMYFVFSGLLIKVSILDHQIWNLLKKAHLVIPILSILVHILYVQQNPQIMHKLLYKRNLVHLVWTPATSKDTQETSTIHISHRILVHNDTRDMTHYFLQTYFKYGHEKMPYLEGPLSAQNMSGGNNVSCLRCDGPWYWIMALKKPRPGPSKKCCTHQSEAISIRSNPETILIDGSSGYPEVAILQPCTQGLFCLGEL